LDDIEKQTNPWDKAGQWRSYGVIRFRWPGLKTKCSESKAISSAQMYAVTNPDFTNEFELILGAAA
jgi:hypothetical protein